MEYRIESYPAFTAVGMKSRYGKNANEIPQLWEAFVPRIGEVVHRDGSHHSYGLMGNYDPATGEFDYMAGLPVTETTDIPAGMTHWAVPQQTYAVFSCTLQTISQTFDAIYKEWIHTAPVTRTSGPEFELYDENFNPNEGRFDVSIWIPVHENLQATY